MIRIFAKMKKNMGFIILIFFLLFLQAVCDLSLPEYTSKIVDTGIQQKGIEDAVPEKMRASARDALLILSDNKGESHIKKAYRAEKSKNYGKVFLLRKDWSDGSKRDLLNKELGRSETILMILEKQKLDVSALPPEALAAIEKKAAEEIDKLPESMVTGSAVYFVRSEYKALGVDLDRMQTDYLFNSAVQMILRALLSMVCSVAVVFLASRVAAELGRDLRDEVYGKVMTFSSREMNKFSTASLITRSTNDIQQIQLVMTLMFRVVLYAPFLAAGGIMKVVQTGSYLSWIIILGTAVVAAVIAVLFIFVMPKFKLLQIKIDRLNLISREILTGVPVIRAFSAEKHEEERFDDANRDLTRTNLFVNRAMTVMMPAMMFIMNGLSVLIIYSGGHGIDSGKMQVGDMMAFLQYAIQIIMSFLMLSMVAVFIPRASVSAKRIFEVLDTDLSIKNPERPKQPDGSIKGLIEFKNVSFSYPGAEESVLKNISFKAEKGRTTAIIGSTGSGKSTLINLIPRFYDVTEGEVLFDGIDVRKMDIHDLRQRIGYVPQKSVLFSGTVASNVRFGRDDAGDDDVREAVDIAQASEFVEKMSDGINSRIAQGGSNVSGGQKQRLSIARAIARKPEIFIFDDSFSALDYRTDATLRRELSEKTKGVTTIIVAQRISTILQADQIIVLDDGGVAGIGSHTELMESCSVYREIAESQLSESDLRKADLLNMKSLSEEGV